MTFLKVHERLILMDMPVKYEQPRDRLPEDDIKAVADAGIETAMMFDTHWEWIEPTKGLYDFSYYDERVNLLNRCGMKVLLQALTHFPTWVPDEWCVRNINGVVQRMISPWNCEAWEYVLRYHQKLVERYNTSDNIVINSWLTDGETMFPNEVCVYDTFATRAFEKKYGACPEADVAHVHEFLEDCQVAMYEDLQRILANNACREVWVTLHPVLANIPGNGCNVLPRVLENLTKAIPGVHINQLFCTWVQWNGYWQAMNAQSAQFHTDVFGGAEYAEGLPTTVPQAVVNRLRGLLINPCHPYTGYTRIAPWMLDSIKAAMGSWK